MYQYIIYIYISAEISYTNLFMLKYEIHFLIKN